MDRPIIFSAPMVQALLAGQKTQTRRLMPNQADLAQAYAPMISGKRILNYAGEEIVSEARYAIGDRLWVREAWSHTGTGVWTIAAARMVGRGGVIYRSDADVLGARYWPSIHMPREFSRLTLIVTDVRVQRLQEISEDDAAAEGVSCDSDGWRDYEMPTTQCCARASDSFRTLWNSLHGPNAWAANPWVVALTFTVERRNIDATPAQPAATHGDDDVE